MRAEDLQNSLARFTGTTDYYRHGSGLFSYTDGVKFLADEAGAYWLIDLIASYQKRCRKDRMLRDFQVWQLRVASRRADAVCLRDADDEAFRQHIPFTEFPLNEITLYLENGVLCLPSER